MADEDKFEIDIEIYKNWCEKHDVEFWDSDAEHFAYSVASRVIDGGQNEDTARKEQFFEMTGIKA